MVDVSPRRRKTSSRGIRASKTLYLFALPGIAALLVFYYLPLAGNAIAFMDYLPYIPLWNSAWVGLSNFAAAFADPSFYNALKNTLIITFVQSVLVFPVPLALALALNSVLSDRLRGIVQTIVYLPHFLSWVIVVSIFQKMLGGSGLVNTLIRSAGGEAVDIMNNPDTFIALITSQVIWKDAGWAAILFFAALAQIDKELYEASAVDGATRFHQLIHITLPGLKGIIILLFILKLGDSLSVGFEQILLQQNAVGRQVSEVIDTFVYNNGVIGGNWGLAAAVGLMKGVFSLLLVLGANKLAHAFGEDGVYRRDR